MNIRRNRYVLAAAILAATPLLHAQSAAPAASDPQPCTTSPQPQPCAPAKPAENGSGSKGPAADRFPFPGETSAPGDVPPSVSPTSPAPPDAPTGSSGDRFPFPGETAPPTPPAAVPGSSSSSSADPTAFPGDDTNTPDPNAPANSKDKPATEGRRLLKRVNPVGTKLLTPDEREAEDLSVAKFYTDQGNLQAAYLRTQDAVKTIPDDPDAHCALAEAAVKLNKRDEAIAEFNTCLKLDPVEKQAKNARRELAKLK